MSYGQINVTQVKFGDSGTASQNFIASVPGTPDGSFALAREGGSQTVLSVNTAGHVRHPNQPMIFGTINGLAGDTSNWFPSLTVASNQGFTYTVSPNRINILTTGYYVVHAHQLVNPVTGVADYFYGLLNGSIVNHGYVANTTNTSGLLQDSYIHFIRYCSAGDYIQFQHTRTAETWSASHSAFYVTLLA